METATGEQDALRALTSPISPFFGWLACNVSLCNDQRSSELRYLATSMHLSKKTYQIGQERHYHWDTVTDHEALCQLEKRENESVQSTRNEHYGRNETPRKNFVDCVLKARLDN
jgi:hypothetical protein